MRCRNLPFGLMALLFALFLGACEEDTPETVERVRAIKTITVADRGAGQLRRFPGVIQAVDTSALSFEVSGNTRDVLVSAGDRVEVGERLATLDETPFRLAVEAAEAEVGRARADLAEKMTEFDRQQTLFRKGWVSQAALDQATAAKESAENQVSYAVSKLNLARRDLEKTVLSAPFAGVIASRLVEPFQEVSRGEKVFELYAEGAMEVVISVPETAIGGINLGLPAEISFPSENRQTLKGRVSEISTVAGNANAFPVKVAVGDAPPDILPGMTAEVALILGQDGDETSFLIPVSALVPGEERGLGFVFVFDPTTETVSKTSVRGGGIRDNRIMIREGLAAGDIIAVAGTAFLRDGQQVKLLTP